jgi:hypothetical protein
MNKSDERELEAFSREGHLERALAAAKVENSVRRMKENNKQIRMYKSREIEEEYRNYIFPL